MHKRFEDATDSSIISSICLKPEDLIIWKNTIDKYVVDNGIINNRDGSVN